MREIDPEALALKALDMSRKAKDPKTALGWLKVAAAWDSLVPDQEPESPALDGFGEIQPIGDEVTRVILRVAENGNAIAIVDPKNRNAFAGKARTPALAAELAMQFLDQLEKIKAQEQE